MQHAYLWLSLFCTSGLIFLIRVQSFPAVSTGILFSLLNVSYEYRYNSSKKQKPALLLVCIASACWLEMHYALSHRTPLEWCSHSKNSPTCRKVNRSEQTLQFCSAHYLQSHIRFLWLKYIRTAKWAEHPNVAHHILQSLDMIEFKKHSCDVFSWLTSVANAAWRPCMYFLRTGIECP